MLVGLFGCALSSAIKFYVSLLCIIALNLGSIRKTVLVLVTTLYAEMPNVTKHTIGPREYTGPTDENGKVRNSSCMVTLYLRSCGSSCM